MSDRRLEILLEEIQKPIEPGFNVFYSAMDQRGKEMCLELLEYMAKNNVRITYNVKMQPIFEYKGEWISKEALFENFL